MSKKFRDEYQGDPPIILTPDSAVHSHARDPNDPANYGRNSRSGPAPLSVEETIEVLSELDKLSAKVQELTETVELKDREIAQLKTRDASRDASEDGGSDSGDALAVDGGAAKDQELAELKDKYLRSLAENENARRRIRQQSEESVKLQKENLLRDLLPIVDNLERAVDAAKGSADGKSIVEGVKMVLASLLDFLKSNGVRPLVSIGEPFDPNRHEAADHVPHPSHPANTVVDEFHRGYLMNDKVLRPARVVVSKGDGNGGRG
jgi:molecular chaperone GrpE